MRVDMDVVAEGLRFPEGPIALADGSVVVTEIKSGVVTEVSPNGDKRVIAETGGGPNGAALGPDGAIYVTNNGGLAWVDRADLIVPDRTPEIHRGGCIQRIDRGTGAVTTLYDSCDGKRLIAPNDLVFDRSGGFWFTDHGCDVADGRKYGALHYARPDGSLIVRALGNLLSPNGVGLSPDETVVYMADTTLGRLWAFDIAGPGRIRKPDIPAPGRVIGNLPGYQMLDSLAVEAGGAICVGTLLEGGITTFNLDGAREFVSFPDFATTNICFGGTDMRDAWVTCSTTGKLYKCRWPRPGLRLNFSA
jgi:gluconolactonase